MIASNYFLGYFCGFTPVLNSPIPSACRASIQISLTRPLTNRVAGVFILTLASALSISAGSARSCWDCVAGAEESTEGVEPDSLFIQPPVIRDTYNQRVPLVVWVEVETHSATEAIVEVFDGRRRWEAVSPTVSQKHSIPVLGMYPNWNHQLQVRVREPENSKEDLSWELSPVIEYTSASLPESFPPIQVLGADSSNMEPGITVVTVNLWQENTSMYDYGYLIGIDQSGGVVWFCNIQDRIADARLLSNGRMIYQHGTYRYLYEIDILGGDHRCWYAARTTAAPSDSAIPVDVDTIHHETLELPNGNFLTLATELRRFTQYPTDVTDPKAPREPAWVVCDEVVEFDPETGNIIQRLPLTDLLDTQRFGYLSLTGFWRDKYNDFLDSPARDWSHANALQYLAEDDSILVSFRHLCCVVKIDWETKEVRWILGDPAGWSESFQKYLLRPQGDIEWFYHQHAPHLTDAGTLLMFDNGNFRAMPFDEPSQAPDNFSRIAAFKINEQEGTVQQVYSYGAPQGDRFYSPFFGEAEILPVTGNLLVTDGGRIETAEGIPHDEVPGGRQWARVFEITRDNYPKKVFELICASPIGSKYGWSIYRSNRYPSLYDSFWLPSADSAKSATIFPRNPPQKVNPLDNYQPVVVGPEG